MKTKKFEVTVTEYDKPEELDKDDRKLLEKSIEALDGSYAPYSQFHVGASVLLENGEIILGSNQENVAYPSGLCAERVALFYAKSKYPDVAIKSIAISSKADNFVTKYPVTPCGACRQVIAEFESQQNKKIKIIMRGQQGPIISTKGIESLLPLVFKENNLKKR
jgi:cytidine deaminase